MAYFDTKHALKVVLHSWLGIQHTSQPGWGLFKEMLCILVDQGASKLWTSTIFQSLEQQGFESPKNRLLCSSPSQEHGTGTPIRNIFGLSTCPHLHGTYLVRLSYLPRQNEYQYQCKLAYCQVVFRMKHP